MQWSWLNFQTQTSPYHGERRSNARYQQQQKASHTFHQSVALLHDLSCQLVSNTHVNVITAFELYLCNIEMQHCEGRFDNGYLVNTILRMVGCAYECTGWLATA